MRWWAVVALCALAAGCGGTALVRVPAAAPPSPATWRPYPAFASRPSCWTRPFGEGVMRAAPSRARPATHLTPQEIVRRLLARFGDRRYVRNVVLGPPPRITLEHLRGYFAGARPPRDALWAWVARRSGPEMVVEWESALVVGALRDDFCAAGGRPLVGWTLGRGGIGVSDRVQALEQRFPSPSPRSFRQRVGLVGRRYGFTVASLRLLRPEQLSPLLVVHTHRDRKAFVHDVPAIMKLLDPISQGRNEAALTFEGFFLEADDDHGPFLRVENVYRGEVEGGQWSWNRCIYPYAHSQPLSANPCPS